mmetsp:Transcript_10222/g.21644  ORF Transcript_10222/g.21644 Transcript_10222/m.21644 type:complete len:258 (+) Transcript_10222:748-1521(+)
MRQCRTEAPLADCGRPCLPTGTAWMYGDGRWPALRALCGRPLCGRPLCGRPFCGRAPGGRRGVGATAASTRASASVASPSSPPLNKRRISRTTRRWCKGSTIPMDARSASSKSTHRSPLTRCSSKARAMLSGRPRSRSHRLNCSWLHCKGSLASPPLDPRLIPSTKAAFAAASSAGWQRMRLQRCWRAPVLAGSSAGAGAGVGAGAGGLLCRPAVEGRMGGRPGGAMGPPVAAAGDIPGPTSRKVAPSNAGSTLDVL